MKSTGQFSRQSFLGEHAETAFQTVRVAVVGVGGGGSHIVQQLLHLGFKDITVFDPDLVEDSNLNRLVGAQLEDIGRPKVDVMARLAAGLAPDARFAPVRSLWQEAVHLLQACDIVFGCVDGFSQRQQLESFARKHLIPYIDIGLDVHVVDGEAPQMAGQVILSMPGSSCMFCLGFLSEEKLAREGLAYGAGGSRPQVVWANGVLASTAIGIAVDLLTNWTRSSRESEFLLYRGNTGAVSQHPKWEFRTQVCSHFPPGLVGAAKLTKL